MSFLPHCTHLLNIMNTKGTTYTCNDDQLKVQYLPVEEQKDLSFNVCVFM